MVHQDIDGPTTRRSDFVFRAIPAENLADIIDRVHVGPNRFNLEAFNGHDPNIDAALVVPVNQHDVSIMFIQEFLIEPDK